MNDNSLMTPMPEHVPSHAAGSTSGRSSHEAAWRLGVMLCQVLAIWLIAGIVTVAYGFELYKTFQTPEAFLAEVFDGAPPAPQVLSLGPAEQSKISAVFGRSFPQSRLRYWRLDGRTAWIFDDIGKEGYVPTTSGFVVSNGVVEHLRVLIYRESRGEQVGEPSFLQKFVGAGPNGTHLDRKIDSISGATLSVQMMERMARTALELNTLVP